MTTTTTQTRLPVRSSATRTARRDSTLSTLAYVAVGTGAMALSSLVVGLGLITLG